jgi:hypothetical protein
MQTPRTTTKQHCTAQHSTARNSRTCWVHGHASHPHSLGVDAWPSLLTFSLLTALTASSLSRSSLLPSVELRREARRISSRSDSSCCMRLSRRWYSCSTCTAQHSTWSVKKSQGMAQRSTAHGVSGVTGHDTAQHSTTRGLANMAHHNVSGLHRNMDGVQNT